MAIKTSILVTSALTALSIAAGTVGAQAGGFALRGQSSYGLGSAFAGIAAPGESPSSMFYNPAAINHQGNGFTSETNLTLLIPRVEINIFEATGPVASSSGALASPTTLTTVPGLGSVPIGAIAPNVGLAAGTNVVLNAQDLGTNGTGNISGIAITPGSYFAANLALFGLSDRITVGLSNTTPFGSTTENDHDSAARFHGRTSELRVINSSPTIGFRVNDAFSVAAGLQVSFADVRLTQAAVFPSSIPGIGVEADTDVEGFDIAAGFTLGATFTPTDRTEIGIGFRSAVFHELDGTFQSTGPSPAVTRDFGGITAELNLPEMVTFGIRHAVTPKVTVMAGVEWTNWSRFEELRIDFDTPGLPDAVTLQNYEDGYYFSLGAEYGVSEALTLRTGLGYEISPVQDEFRSVRQPDSDRIWASLGASYEINERFALNLSYSHIFADDAPINLALADNLSRGALRGEGNTAIDIVGIALRSKFGHSAPTEEIQDVFYKN